MYWYYLCKQGVYTLVIAEWSSSVAHPGKGMVWEVEALPQNYFIIDHILYYIYVCGIGIGT